MSWEIEKIGQKIKKAPLPYLAGGVGIAVVVFLFWPRQQQQEEIYKYPTEESLPQYQSQGVDLSGVMGELAYMMAENEARRSDELASMMTLQLGAISEMQATSQDLFSQLAASQRDAIERMEREAVRQTQSSYSTPTPSYSSSSGAVSSTPSSNNKESGYAYVDKYGFSHVVASQETAEKYAAPGTSISQYQGDYYGGYARDEQGERVSLGGVPYGN